MSGSPRTFSANHCRNWPDGRLAQRRVEGHRVDHVVDLLEAQVLDDEVAARGGQRLEEAPELLGARGCATWGRLRPSTASARRAEDRVQGGEHEEPQRRRLRHRRDVRGDEGGDPDDQRVHDDEEQAHRGQQEAAREGHDHRPDEALAEDQDRGGHQEGDDPGALQLQDGRRVEPERERLRHLEQAQEQDDDEDDDPVDQGLDHEAPHQLTSFIADATGLRGAADRPREAGIRLRRPLDLHAAIGAPGSPGRGRGMPEPLRQQSVAEAAVAHGELVPAQLVHDHAHDARPGQDDVGASRLEADDLPACLRVAGAVQLQLAIDLGAVEDRSLDDVRIVGREAVGSPPRCW